MAAPTLAGLLFLLPPSIAQTNADSPQSSVWQSIIARILNLPGNEDISNKELRNQILTLLEDTRKLNNDNIQKLRDKVENQQETDTENILDKLDELDENISSLSVNLRNIRRMGSEINDLKELNENLNGDLNRIKEIIDNIKSETDKIQDLRKMLRNVEADIEDIRGKLGEN